MPKTPSLNPAVRQGKRIYTGTPADSHEIIVEREGLRRYNILHGFVGSNSPRMFLDRKQALQWLQRFDPEALRKMKGRIPPEGLHSHIYAAAKGIVQKLTKEQKDNGLDIESGEAPQTSQAKAVDLSKETILVMDRGLKVFLAQFLGRFYDKVYYHPMTLGGPYLDNPTASIGEGMLGIEHTVEPWTIIKDNSGNENFTVFFPDVYDGSLQDMLRAFKVPVCGPGAGEKLELDKLEFYNVLKSAKLPVADMHLCHGLDELLEYGKNNLPFVVKLRDHYRDDWETTKFDDYEDLENFVTNKRQKLGARRCETMELLCYALIESECEGGIDGFRLGGKMANLVSCGYECKDMGYVTKILDHIPEIFQPELDALAPEYEKLGFAGPWSNESRITKDGTAYPIDQTCRCGEPPTAVLCELLGESYALAIHQLARGIMPTLKAVAPYGAQVNLSSPYHKAGNELPVSFPKELEQWVKLENSVCHEGKYRIINNENDGGFGMVVAIGKSIDEVTKTVLERVEQVKARGMEYKPDCFSEIGKAIEQGRKYGIEI